MKSKIIFLAVAGTFLFALSACDSTTGNPSSEQSTTTTQSTMAETTTTTAEDEHKLNLDVISDYGLTYSEIEEKRGKLIDVDTSGGGVYYIFENGYGNYEWGMHDIDNIDAISNIKPDENGNMNLDNVPLPMPDVACKHIDDISIERLLLGIEFPATISDMKEFTELKYHGFDVGGMKSDYVLEFSYEDNIKILIRTDHINQDNNTDDTEDNILIDKDASVVMFDHNKDD